MPRLDAHAADIANIVLLAALKRFRNIRHFPIPNQLLSEVFNKNKETLTE
jgi:hypothetical protein